jgi:hypothetical protein
MPDLYMDVDAAVTVPVNILPLIASADFKTVLASQTYNEAGLDLVWNFVTSAGVQTHTAVTPTDTGGNYDWVNIGHGMYNIEIPASGGASINNDTEGFGWFTGVATDALPWRGPIIGFRAAGLNDLLMDTAYSTTRGLTGTALPAAAADAAGGLPISDAGGLDLDTRIDAAISSRLAPTTAARTLDVTSTGAAGIDWGNVENPSTANDLAATNINAIAGTVTIGNIPAGNITFTNESDLDTNILGLLARVPAALTAGGKIPASMDEILATALTETAGGYLAAGVKKFYDVVTPSSTMNLLTAVTTAGTATALGAQAKLDVNAEVVDVLRTDTLPDSYAAHEAQPTIAQAVLEILQFLTEKSVSSTTVSVKKPDGSTAIMEFTLDSATAPTSITRKANP